MFQFHGRIDPLPIAGGVALAEASGAIAPDGEPSSLENACGRRHEGTGDGEPPPKVTSAAADSASVAAAEDSRRSDLQGHVDASLRASTRRRAPQPDQNAWELGAGGS
ncbi:unnamed protein product [Urochloa humidicola]